jgi:hypothetical protein
MLKDTPAEAFTVPAFTVGDDRAQAMAGRVVAVSISVNVDIKIGDREFSACVPLHEIPLLKRKHANGMVTIRPDWVPALERTRRITEAALKEELDRLNHIYVIAVEKGKVDLVGEVFGVTDSERLRGLHSSMRKLHDGWVALYVAAVDAVRKKRPVKEDIAKLMGNRQVPAVVAARVEERLMLGWTGDALDARDIQRLVDSIDPAANGELDSIELPEVNDDAVSAALAHAQDAVGIGDDTDLPPHEQAEAALVGAGLGLDATTAAEVASLWAEFGGDIPRGTLGNIEGCKGKVRAIEDVLAKLQRPATA